MPDPPAPSPAQTSVNWYQSRSFRAIVQSSVLSTLGWLLVALGTNVWDWRTGLAVPLVSNLLVVLRDMWSVTIQGPFDFMNKTSVPPADPRPPQK